jgi:hypothetical protein
MSAGNLQCDDQLILPTSLMGQSVKSNDVAWFPVHYCGEITADDPNTTLEARQTSPTYNMLHDISCGRPQSINRNGSAVGDIQ